MVLFAQYKQLPSGLAHPVAVTFTTREVVLMLQTFQARYVGTVRVTETVICLQAIRAPVVVVMVMMVVVPPVAPVMMVPVMVMTPVVMVAMMVTMVMTVMVMTSVSSVVVEIVHSGRSGLIFTGR